MSSFLQFFLQNVIYSPQLFLTASLVRGVIPPPPLPPFLDQPPFSKIPPFLEIQDVPIFHRSLGKTKVLNNSCNQFLYHCYPQSILVLKEYLQKW